MVNEVECTVHPSAFDQRQELQPLSFTFYILEKMAWYELSAVYTVAQVSAKSKSRCMVYAAFMTLQGHIFCSLNTAQSNGCFSSCAVEERN